MSDARRGAEQFFNFFAAGKIDEATALFAPSCVTLMPTGRLTQPEHEQMGHAFKSAFPDSSMHVDRMVESGDEVVVLGFFRGTHTGDLQSPSGRLPASGNEINLRFMDYFKVHDGMIVDHQTIFDQVEMLGQLGAIPTTA
nr:hypothetical protein [uncultured bacterium]